MDELSLHQYVSKFTYVSLNFEWNGVIYNGDSKQPFNKQGLVTMDKWIH